ncbi:MAG: nuclear transport factor 2 family protein [Chitinophagaceae bacterium]
MSSQQQIIETFYQCFSRRDAAGMNACYSDDIIFQDPAFGRLHGDEVRAMWQMLCEQALDFSLTYGPVVIIDEEYATCEWVANYTFSKTGNKITNRIKAFMRIQNGKIIEHSDAFRLSTWISQALGWKGVLFGWTGFMKRAVQRRARQSLQNYMEKRNS